MTKEIMNAVNTQIFGVWFLIGAALVFWMQAGFAMVEAGFTRAKNAGNIIMKLFSWILQQAISSCQVLRRHLQKRSNGKMAKHTH